MSEVAARRWGEKGEQGEQGEDAGCQLSTGRPAGVRGGGGSLNYFVGRRAELLRDDIA